MLINDLYNKKIAIWGMGAEGQSVKSYLEKHKITEDIFEYNDSDGLKKYHELLKKVDVIIRSPGVSIYKDEIKEAKEKGIKITSSSDLFLNENSLQELPNEKKNRFDVCDEFENLLENQKNNQNHKVL